MTRIDWDRIDTIEYQTVYGLPTLPPAKVESVDLDAEPIRDYTDESREYIM